MIKKIILGLCILATGGAYAQQGTASPYSFYGIGDVKFKGPHEIRAMGSLAIYRDSLHINTLNPASYSNLQSTVFSVGLTNTSNYVDTDTNSASANRTSFDYFAMAFPAGKFGFAFGIMPYSFVGYSISNRVEENGFDVSRTFTGDGGINRGFFGVSYKISNQLSIGAEFAYNFGDTELSTQKFIYNDGTDLAIDRGTQLHRKNNYSGITYNTAINYTKPLYKNVSLDVGVTFSPETKLRNDLEATYSIFRVDPTSGSLTTVDQRTTNSSNRDLVDPMKYSIGAGIGDPNKWFVGAEYTGINSSKLDGYYQAENAVYKNGHKFAVGGFFTPDHVSRTSIFSRTTYRAGLRYDYSGFQLNGENINDMAATLGFGMPIGTRVGGFRSISNVNVTLEYGQRGTTANGLINERYFNVSIGFSFNDRWFVRRKYD